METITVCPSSLTVRLVVKINSTHTASSPSKNPHTPPMSRLIPPTIGSSCTTRSIKEITRHMINAITSDTIIAVADTTRLVSYSDIPATIASFASSIFCSVVSCAISNNSPTTGSSSPSTRSSRLLFFSSTCASAFCRIFSST